MSVTDRYGPGDDEASSRWRVHLCFGPNCTERGSRSLLPILEDAVAEAGIADQVEILATTCRNRCDFGPSLNVYPGPVFYNHLDPEALREIVHEHLLQGRVCHRWVFNPSVAPARRR